MWAVFKNYFGELRNQLIGVVVLVVITAQVISFVVLCHERQTALLQAKRHHLLERTVAVVTLLSELPAAQHQQVLKTMNVGKVAFTIDDTPVLLASDPLDMMLQNELNRQLYERGIFQEPLAGSPPPALAYQGHPIERWQCRDVYKTLDKSEVFSWTSWLGGGQAHPCFAEVVISIALGGGHWLTVSANLLPSPFLLAIDSIFSLSLTLVLLTLLIILVVRRITRPLNDLSEAAMRIGRGESIEPLKEYGPSNIRQTVRAFNEMHQSQQRFVQERTQLLAAISHDLRTPITSMRLRVELLPEGEERQRLLCSLEEMAVLANSSLEFVRESSVGEETREVDINALLSSLCEDLADAGSPVYYEDMVQEQDAKGQRVVYACRPLALKRAFDNLILNAVKYGQEARVSAIREDTAILVTVADDGPGIPESDFEKVFEPFTRLEDSRNRHTGGVGLGLSIARSIVRGHGGDIQLYNRGRGLSVVVRLPV